jgi:hypothetical protein
MKMDAEASIFILGLPEDRAQRQENGGIEPPFSAFSSDITSRNARC